LDLDHSTQADPSVASPADAGDATTAPIRSLAATQFAALPPGTATFATKAACELWAKDNIATPVLAQLNQPFGEDRLTQSFTVVAAFRHVLCPVIKSGFFFDSDLAALEQAYAPAAWFSELLHTHALVDFSRLRDPIPQDLESDYMMPLCSCMFAALLLHYDLSVSAAVRWMGGTHAGAHRDHHHILSTLANAQVDDDIVCDLRCICLDGAPASINAESTDANFWNCYTYGNHKTIFEDTVKTKKAMLKDVRRGCNLVANSRLTVLIPHLHPTPVGMVDLAKIYKEPHPMFDSSFRPVPSSMAINDWVDPANEPTRFARCASGNRQQSVLPINQGFYNAILPSGCRQIFGAILGRRRPSPHLCRLNPRPLHQGRHRRSCSLGKNSGPSRTFHH
jgi:hypothetical protein